jgi:hypothetical protein
MKDLARLVRKYGRDVIGGAAKTVSVRGPGRPSRDNLPFFERMHLADWIEEQAEEYRQAGSRKPYRQAEIDLYELMYDDDAKSRDFEKFQKTKKKARQRGRQHWRELAQQVHKHPGAAKDLGQSLRSWLRGHK